MSHRTNRKCRRVLPPSNAHQYTLTREACADLNSNRPTIDGAAAMKHLAFGVTASVVALTYSPLRISASSPPSSDVPLNRTTNCAIASAYLSARFYGSTVDPQSVINLFPAEQRDVGCLVPAQDIAGVMRQLGYSSSVIKIPVE